MLSHKLSASTSIHWKEHRGLVVQRTIVKELLKAQVLFQNVCFLFGHFCCISSPLRLFIIFQHFQNLNFGYLKIFETCNFFYLFTTNVYSIFFSFKVNTFSVLIHSKKSHKNKAREKFKQVEKENELELIVYSTKLQIFSRKTETYCLAPLRMNESK